jgi:seryl-tRNA synthetase
VSYRPATPDQEAFLAELVSARLLVPSGVPGVFGRGSVFEEVRVRFEAFVAEVASPDGAEQLRFPPVLPRRHLETAGYLKSFPHLLGTIFSFSGDEADAATQAERGSRGENWDEFQQMTDLVLMPAACYPVYPAMAARGPLDEAGAVVDAGGAYVFRHEPSGDPARLQMFHQREMVRIGDPEAVEAWRDAWRNRALELLRALGLDAALDVASDPFFGRGSRLLGVSQREQQLKFEILVPIAGDEPTAVASFNYHQDHFATAFGIVRADGGPVHTACLGLGEERIVLALLRTHGLDPGSWPADVRAKLWGSPR